MTTTRRKFLTTGALGGAAALAAPAVHAQSTIRWRMQTYAGASLGAQVAKPAIDMFNAIAGDEMQIDLFYADQLVPTGELFQAMQRGTIDAVQSDDDSMASPTEVTVFGGYFPFASRYSLDVPALFNNWGLNEIWGEEYAKVGVKHISAGSWDPCHFITSTPITSLADLRGKRVFTFPTAGRFLSQFGVVPVTVPWEDVEIALQTREIDGVAWCGITEAHEVGWADVTSHFLTNNIFGRVDRAFLFQHGTLERIAAASAGSDDHLFRTIALLSPALVLGRRSPSAYRKQEAGTDIHSRR
jgi:TRAP-type C4-dicarboxylate transport system substrate-binding protein